MQATEVVISALVAVENSQPEVARLLLDVASAIVQAGQVRVHQRQLTFPKQQPSVLTGQQRKCSSLCCFANARQVELVLAVVEQRWARSADPSQVRYFIFKVAGHT